MNLIYVLDKGFYFKLSTANYENIMKTPLENDIFEVFHLEGITYVNRGNDSNFGNEFIYIVTDSLGNIILGNHKERGILSKKDTVKIIGGYILKLPDIVAYKNTRNYFEEYLMYDDVLRNYEPLSYNPYEV